VRSKEVSSTSMKPEKKKPSSKEKSRYAAQVVVYELKQGSWVSARALGPKDDEDEGNPAEEEEAATECAEDGEVSWSEMHLFSRKAATKAFRVVAWNAQEEVVLNVKLKQKMSFALTAPDFGELRGGDKVYGFYFAAAEQADETAAAVRNALEELKHPRASESLASFEAVRNATVEAAARQEADPSFSPSQALEHAYSKTHPQEEEEDNPTSTSGEPPSPSEDDVVIEPITNVSDFRHDTHVVFNAEKSRYEGLPQGWTHVNKQFGVELDKVPQTGQVPTVLLMLEETLKRLNGLQVTGIFRVAPDGEDCRDAREAIDSGEGWDKFEDVHVVATLIKQFFRDLPPVGLLNRLDDHNVAKIAHVATHPDEEDPDALIRSVLDATLDAPHRSLLDWLFDLMADVVLRADANKMTSKNMAIVMSPNLYSTALGHGDPMAAITMAQKVADCTNAILDWRLRQRAAA